MFAVLDNLVTNLNKDDFKYLNQDFDSNVLDLVKQKGFYFYKYRVILKCLKKNCQVNKRFIVFSQTKKADIKNMTMFLKFGIYFK